jgi:hypothetical protein
VNWFGPFFHTHHTDVQQSRSPFMSITNHQIGKVCQQVNHEQNKQAFQVKYKHDKIRRM